MFRSIPYGLLTIGATALPACQGRRKVPVMTLLSLAVLLSGCDTCPTSPETNTVIIDDRISDESYRAWRFDLPSRGRNFRLKGQFVVTSGGNRDINAYVVDAVEFANYRGSNPNFYPIYSRRRVSTGEFDLPLDKNSGPYYFILSNTFSLFTDKWVKGEVTLTYDHR